MPFFLATAILLSLIPTHAFAGYRVHKLKLYYYNDRGKIIRRGETLSTLDHLQYEHYNGGFRTVRAELLDTWYCPGDTSRQKLCDKPKLAPTRGLASTDPKRQAIEYNRTVIRP